MRPRHAVAAVAVAAAALVLAGWSSAAPQVRHGSVRLAHRGPGRVILVVDIWRDASNGELAFRLRGDRDVTIFRARTIFDVIEGKLSDATLYSSPRRAWSVISARFGVTESRTSAVLVAGETVARPKLMTVPKPDPNEYTFSRDFGTDLVALRRAARFAVPSPGPRLDGRALWDVSLSHTRTANVGDSGPVGVVIYSNKTSGEDQVLLNVAAAGSGSGTGATYSDFFARSKRPVGGSGVEARLVDEGEAILRYHDSYVLVQLDGRTTDSRWRNVLRKIAQS